MNKHICKSICEHLNDGVCMGLCSTDHEYVQSCYDGRKAEALRKGETWVDIPVFELSHSEKPSAAEPSKKDEKLNEPSNPSSQPRMSFRR